MKSLQFLPFILAQVIGAFTGPNPARQKQVLTVKEGTSYQPRSDREAYSLKLLDFVVGHVNMVEKTGIKMPTLQTKVADFLAWAKTAESGALVFGPADHDNQPKAGDLAVYSNSIGVVEKDFNGDGFVSSIEYTRPANPEFDGVYRAHNRLGTATSFIRLAAVPVDENKVEIKEPIAPTAKVEPPVAPAPPTPLAAPATVQTAPTAASVAPSKTA